MNERGTRVSQVYSQYDSGWAASVVDLAAQSSSDELSSPRRIEPAHFGCVENNIEDVGRCGVVGSTLAFGSIGHVMGSNPSTAYFHIMVHQPAAS